MNNVAGPPGNIGNEEIRVYSARTADGYVVLEMGNVHHPQVLVLNAMGRTVLSTGEVKQLYRVGMAGMAKGLYFIKVMKDTEVAGG